MPAQSKKLGYHEYILQEPLNAWKNKTGFFADIKLSKKV